MPKAKEPLVRVPLFENNDISELARRTGYSELYLCRMKSELPRLRPMFAAMVSMRLSKPVEELFGDLAKQLEVTS